MPETVETVAKDAPAKAAPKLSDALAAIAAQITDPAHEDALRHVESAAATLADAGL